MKTLLKNGLLFSGEPDKKAIPQDILIDEDGKILEISEFIFCDYEDLNVIELEGK